jgi:hypothetical protein
MGGGYKRSESGIAGSRGLGGRLLEGREGGRRWVGGGGSRGATLVSIDAWGAFLFVLEQ